MREVSPAWAATVSEGELDLLVNFWLEPLASHENNALCKGKSKSKSFNTQMKENTVNAPQVLIALSQLEASLGIRSSLL